MTLYAPSTAALGRRAHARLQPAQRSPRGARMDRRARRRLGAETVPLEDAAGRILAADVVSRRSTCRDSIAPRWMAMRCAARRRRARASTTRSPFRCTARRCPAQPFAGVVPANAAIRIMTGAPVPEGVDAVVPAEYATETAGRSRSRGRSRPASTSGTRGEDIRRARRRSRAGRRLRPQDVGLIASLGMARVSRRPAAARAHSRHRQRGEGAGRRRRVRIRSTTRIRTCCAVSSRATAACSRRTTGSATIPRRFARRCSRRAPT